MNEEAILRAACAAWFVAWTLIVIGNAIIEEAEA